MKRNLIFQHDNNLKHKSKSTKELLQKKKNVLKWLSQRLALNPVEKTWMAWTGWYTEDPPAIWYGALLKGRMGGGELTNQLVDSYSKRLAAVFKAKGVSAEKPGYFKSLSFYFCLLFEYCWF